MEKIMSDHNCRRQRQHTERLVFGFIPAVEHINCLLESES